MPKEADDIRDMAKGLINAEPLMVIGNTLAAGGRKLEEIYDTGKRKVNDLVTRYGYRAKPTPLPATKKTAAKPPALSGRR